jgi:hypothetical protein
LYEDGLELCAAALKIKRNHEKTLIRKAVCLGYLFEFEKSIELFKHIMQLDWAEKMERMRDLARGNYSRFIMTKDKFLQEKMIFNYATGVQIEMTKEMGRGIFVTQHIKRGNLIIIEQAIAEGREDAKKEMVCQELVQGL